MVGVVLGSRTLRPWRLGVLMTRGGAAHGPATCGSCWNGFYQSLSKDAWSFGLQGRIHHCQRHTPNTPQTSGLGFWLPVFVGSEGTRHWSHMNRTDLRSIGLDSKSSERDRYSYPTQTNSRKGRYSCPITFSALDGGATTSRWPNSGRYYQ